MTDKYIVSKSEIENFILEIENNNHPEHCWSWTDTEITYLVGELRNILDNSQVVNSAPFGYVDLEQAIRAFDYGYGAVYLFNPKELKAIEDYDPLYTTPQPAPDTVPLEKYNKLIGILKRMEGWLEVRNLGGLMPDEKALIAEAEGKS